MTIEELNAITAGPDADEFVRVCEARQCKALSKLADEACARDGIRLALLAGASSAGKTTTAKRFCTQLRVNGREALLLSTDDYFVGDKLTPRDENGELDYETVDAVDVSRLAADVNALLDGKAIRPRRFDFAKHEGYDAPGELRLAPGGWVAIEGIHALNPRLTEGIDDACKYRVFIEPSTQPELFFKTCLSVSDARLVRRIVRDCHYRNRSPTETLKMWPKVCAGEAKWITPFRGLADATFDSALAYELAVLKPYVGGLLVKALHGRLPVQVRPKAEMLAELLMTVHPLVPTAVPGDSILRETIGGSQLDY